MSTDDKDLIDQGLSSLGDADARSEAEENAALEELADRVEEPGLQDKIMSRYMAFGRDLLADQLPSQIDPRIAKQLEPILGDVGNVRIHTGSTATAAARAMDARAFALGDQDVFIDKQQFDPTSRAGAALIAHEVAHTRDANTGFALSSTRGSGTSDREAFAEAVESRVYAMEDELAEASTQLAQSVVEADETAKPPVPKIDKDALTQRIWEILEEQQRATRDRHGH
ncbi:MAG: DUF4157 domain-containing protein [Myxococcota bacterium]|jgi:hypothetical protein|nr:DUF4157 domain-containing protein [Myxococcota bacterium]